MYVCECVRTNAHMQLSVCVHFAVLGVYTHLCVCTCAHIVWCVCFAALSVYACVCVCICTCAHAALVCVHFAAKCACAYVYMPVFSQG